MGDGSHNHNWDYGDRVLVLGQGVFGSKNLKIMLTNGSKCLHLIIEALQRILTLGRKYLHWIHALVVEALQRMLTIGSEYLCIGCSPLAAST